MATTVTAPTTSKRVSPLDGTAFDVLFLCAVLWFITGIFSDAWAHNHIPKLETFWTPWHAVLYSGLVMFALVIFGTLVFNRRRVGSWRDAIPKGYELSYLGVILMMVDGVGDMTWHLLFGVEQNVDAIFSPTHLGGMVAIGLIVAGPYRAMYHYRKEPATFKGHLLLALAATLLLVFIATVSQSASIYDTLWPVVAGVGNDTAQLLAVTSFLLQGIIFTGLTLYTVRRWHLAFGFFTFVLTVVAIPLSLMQNHYIVIPVSFAAGLLIDAAYWYLKPSVIRIAQFRIFATIAACTLFAVYMVALVLTQTVVWTIHMRVGAVVVVAIAGWLLSYVALPTQPAQEQR